jgi:hypothetical protein
MVDPFQKQSLLEGEEAILEPNSMSISLRVYPFPFSTGLEALVALLSTPLFELSPILIELSLVTLEAVVVTSPEDSLLLQKLPQVLLLIRSTGVQCCWRHGNI